MPSIDQLYTWHIFFSFVITYLHFFEKEEELSKFIRKNGI